VSSWNSSRFSCQCR